MENLIVAMGGKKAELNIRTVIDLTVDYFDKTSPYDHLDANFVSRLSAEGAVSPCVLIIALLYLERIRKKNKEYYEGKSPDDLFAIALLCASKFLFDDGIDDSVYNGEWATSCSKSLRLINKLEIEFLQELDWRVLVRGSDFFSALSLLEQVLARRQISSRGFCTYTELEVLSRNIGFQKLHELILKPIALVIGIVSLSYLLALGSLYNVNTPARAVNQTLLAYRNDTDEAMGKLLPYKIMDRPDLSVDSFTAGSRISLVTYQKDQIIWLRYFLAPTNNSKIDIDRIPIKFISF
ncbi:protein CNPPD1 [Trichuris trichiura]|uniref:Protein CNPPD1 n=1 Tax=Trichuris trichiura TaxID=36087 RepID=A0A077ZHF7_TRITR|nr:protein CNPPD1 [Trichuris trichiura]